MVKFFCSVIIVSSLIVWAFPVIALSQGEDEAIAKSSYEAALDIYFQERNLEALVAMMKVMQKHPGTLSSGS